MSDLVIHALRVKGGILALCPMPGGGGNYDADLDHLRDWKPAIVLTLTSEAELVERGAARLGQDLRDMGTRWVHMPVEDYGIPTTRDDLFWPRIRVPVLAALGGGSRVLVHCKGGCGRSGMAVLRLMIEAGEDPQQALRRLRALRPCAVETDDQMAWAMDGVPAG